MDARGTDFSFEVANLIRAFGADWRRDWASLTEFRRGTLASTRLAIGPMRALSAIRRAVRISADRLPVDGENHFPRLSGRVQSGVRTGSKEFAHQLVPLREDRRMIGYFMRNEPHWAFVEGLDLTRLMLESPSVSLARNGSWSG